MPARAQMSRPKRPLRAYVRRPGLAASVGGVSPYRHPSTGRRCRSCRVRWSGHDEGGSMSPSTTAVERYQPVLTESEQSTLLGFLAGYRGFTRDASTLDLRQFTAWCWQHDRRLFDFHRADIECFARHLEDAGRARATVARRLCTVVGFYRYAEEEGVSEHSPAVHVRRPRIDDESHVAHLDRNELGAVLVTAGLGSAHDHALVSLLASNTLRVVRGDRRRRRSPRPRARPPHVRRPAQGRQDRHRATACRPSGRPRRRRTQPRPDLHRTRRSTLNRHAAGRIVRRDRPPSRDLRSGSGHMLRHAFITATLDAGVP